MIRTKDIANSATNTFGSQAGRREHSASRREFLARVPSAAAATLASAAIPFSPLAQADTLDGFTGSPAQRIADSLQIRLAAAQAEAQLPIPKQITNGDEQNYSNFIGNFSKGLPHTSPLGEVVPAAYSSYLNALARGTATALEDVTLGGNTKLVNPLAGLCFDLEGTDSHQLAIPPFPSVSSQALADQAVELYWMALCRDVNFLDYETNPLTQAAALELSKLTAFNGPRSQKKVTSQTLFRGLTKEDAIGPYVAQFLLRPFNYGPYAMSGTMSMYAPGIDYMTDQYSWLAAQNGQGPFPPNTAGATRFACTGRDLCVYVHDDPNAGLLISFYNAGIWLFEQNAPLNPGNPYTKYNKQVGFATFGVPHFLCLLGEAKQRACKAAWYAKWFVHRALRPEAYGGLVHWAKSGHKAYPVHSDIVESSVLDRIYQYNKQLNLRSGSGGGTYLLPQAFPEGSPQHPSYPQGHATMAGACATMLKAAFDGSVQFNTLSNGAILTANGDGTRLIPYTGADADQITVNGEINKLASNIGQARNFAGIHWRSDYMAGLLLGEVAALSVLSDQGNIYAGEDFDGFVITKFDGTMVTL